MVPEKPPTHRTLHGLLHLAARKAIALRKSLKAVRYGTFREHFKLSGKQYVYSLTTQGQKILVVCAFGEKETKLRLPKGFDRKTAKLVLQTHDNDGDTLKAYESRVYLWEE